VKCLQAQVWLGVCSLLAVLIVGCGGSDEGAPETTVEVRDVRIAEQDDFSDPTSGWPSRADAESEAGYAEGAYRIVVKQEDWGGYVYDYLEPRLVALRLEVEATQITDTSGDRIGATCYTDIDSDVGYEFGIEPVDRSYYVSAFQGEDYRDLETSEEAADAIRPQEEENRLRIECIVTRNGPTVLTLAVNGEALVRTEDEGEGREFDGIGFFAATTEGGAEALFDDLVVTELALE
jgi:hypothetical protein